MAVTVPRELLAEQVYNPLSLDLVSQSFHVFPVCNGCPLLSFPLYHVTEGEGFPSTGQVRMVGSPGKTRYVLFLSITCGETKRKEKQLGIFSENYKYLYV